MVDDAQDAPRAQSSRGFYGWAIAAIVVVLDQISKFIVLNVLEFSPPGCLSRGLDCGRIELSPIFDLSMVWNRGISFGLFQADSDIGRWVLMAFAIGVSGALGWWLRTVTRPLSVAALGLVIGGAVGNLIDRALFGAVVDFFDFSGLGFPWVFNVADAAINVGVGLLLLDLILEGRQQRNVPN